jgi:hypothetical protein
MTEQENPSSTDPKDSRPSIDAIVAGIFQHGNARGETLRQAVERIRLRDQKDYRLIIFFFSYDRCETM